MGRHAEIEHDGLKPWEPAELSVRHKHMVALSAIGLRNNEIAELLGLSQSRVSVILNDPRARELRGQLAQSAISELVEDAKGIIQAHTAEAAKTMTTLMRHAESENVRRLSAADILDRGGFKPKETVQHQVVEIGREEVELLVEGMREAEEPEKELEFVEDSSGVFQERQGVVEDPEWSLEEEETDD